MNENWLDDLFEEDFDEEGLVFLESDMNPALLLLCGLSGMSPTEVEQMRRDAVLFSMPCSPTRH